VITQTGPQIRRKGLCDRLTELAYACAGVVVCTYLARKLRSVPVAMEYCSQALASLSEEKVLADKSAGVSDGIHLQLLREWGIF